MEYITSWIEDRSNILFSKELVDSFSAVAQKESFWLNLYNKNNMDDFIKNLAPEDDIFISLDEFEQLSNIFATIIDNKSTFTAFHSKEIADLAYKISIHLKYDDKKALKMKISGLLHDIGKVAILDKEGSLNNEEFALIKSHVYYTNLILSKISNIDDICEWASNHHEKLNGTGYPNRISGENLSEKCRIMAVCDIYQALIADRPYRKGMTDTEAFLLMDKMVEQKFICSKALRSLKVMISN